MLQFDSTSNKRGRAASLIYPGCLSLPPPPPPPLVGGPTGLQTPEVYPARPTSSAWASCSEPCPCGRPAAPRTPDAWARAHARQPESQGEGAGVGTLKYFPGAHTHSHGGRSVNHSSDSVDVTSQTSEIHSPVLHFHCSWLGASPCNLSASQKQLPHTSFHVCFGQSSKLPPALFFQNTNPNLSLLLLKFSGGSLWMNDGACLLRWWRRICSWSWAESPCLKCFCIFFIFKSFKTHKKL